MNTTESAPSFFKKYQFWILFFAALIVHQIPIVSVPLKWFESYFHELSHGLAAIVSGGSVVSIALFPNGAGLCTTRGGSAFLISFMGYAGATAWGATLYSIARSSIKVARPMLFVLLLMLGLSIVLWVRDLLTLVIILCLIALLASTFKFTQSQYLQYSLKFIGVSVLLNSVYSPWYLVDGRSIGDGQALADLTMIPELVWIIVWIGLALITAFFLGKKQS